MSLGKLLFVVWSAGCFQLTMATSIAHIGNDLSVGGHVLTIRTVERVPVGNQDESEPTSTVQFDNTPEADSDTSTDIGDEPANSDTSADIGESVRCSLNSQCSQWKAACVGGHCTCVSPWFPSPYENECMRGMESYNSVPSFKV